jgi:N-acetylmuramoyl-L-alanine amidase
MTTRSKIRIFRELGLALLSGCGTEESVIPSVDGRLVLEVRYPTAEPVAATDSIGFWGTTGSGKARLSVNGRSVEVAPNGGFAGFVPFPVRLPLKLEFEATKGPAKVTKVIPLTVVRNRPTQPLAVRPARGWQRLRRLPSDTLDPATQARPIYSRWTPGGALALPLPQGARLPADGETDDAIRLRLASGLLVWVPREETEPVSPPAEPARVLHDLRLTSTGGHPTVELAVAEPVPSAVEVIDTRMRWTLFGVRARIERVRSADGLVRDLAARELPDGRVIVDIGLSQSPSGWRTRWRDGRATLEIRPNRAGATGRGLAGLVVALDPGHPPEGTIGPTGLREDSMSLAVATRAAAKLRALGADPILTRATPGPVSLEARVVAAEAADPDLLISIHANAPAEGRPPWSVDGTRVYWLSPRSSVLAGAIRDSVAAAMEQVKAGTFESNLAVLRSSWFPSVLVEATAMTMPIREAYLRSERGVDAYASGIVSGIRAWVAKQTTSRSP